MQKMENTSDTAIEVIQFAKSYRKSAGYVVKDINFKVKPGEFHGFIGANGAGKTTTIKSLIGAYARYEGNIKIFGFDNNSIQAKKKIGYIPEAANFPKELNTFNYIKHMAHVQGMSLKEAKDYATKVLKEIGLAKFQHRKPSTFSSGQKKKVLLAQALIHDPEIIIMDEPAANLDPKARFDFFKTLKALQKRGKAIFISSHILAELDAFVDSVTILDEGKVVYTGSVSDITKQDDTYEVSPNVDDVETVKKYFKSNKIETTKSGDTFIAKLDKSQYISFMKFLLTKKIILIKLNQRKMNLQEVYTKAVVEKKEVKNV